MGHFFPFDCCLRYRLDNNFRKEVKHLRKEVKLSYQRRARTHTIVHALYPRLLWKSSPTLPASFNTSGVQPCTSVILWVFIYYFLAYIELESYLNELIILERHVWFAIHRLCLLWSIKGSIWLCGSYTRGGSRGWSQTSQTATRR